jgi:hypothetical protein
LEPRLGPRAFAFREVAEAHDAITARTADDKVVVSLP